MRDNPYIPHEPTEKQWDFLLAEEKDVMFGGAAGPGKSDALLMASLMYYDVPHYAAILFRRTFPNLKKAKSLIPRSHEWLEGTDARWRGKNHEWKFPSGAILAFGHMQYEQNRFNYNSAEYQFIGFDEAAEFTEIQFRFLFSRLRKTTDNPAPLRFRSASNPIGPGFRWVRDRYVKGEKKFISASLESNPHIERDEYAETLSNLDPVTRKKLLNGNWEISNQGAIYSSFTEDNVVKELPEMRTFWIGVDYGITHPTVCLPVGLGKDGIFYIVDEYYYAGGEEGNVEKTDVEFSKDFRKFFKDLADEFEENSVYLTPRWIWIDPSASSFINQLWQDKSKCPPFRQVKKANNEVMDGIRRIRSLIQSNKLRVHEKCEETIDEFYDYSWDKNAKQKGEDKPKKENDHCFDGQTEILTEEGWTLFDNLTGSQKVAAKNEDGYINYRKPNEIIKTYHDGKMYKYDGNNVNFVISPNHNLLVANQYSVKVKGNPKYSFIKPNDLPNTSWVSRVGDIQNGERISKSKAHLIGFYLAEGSKSLTRGRKYVHLDQKDPEILEYFQEHFGGSLYEGTHCQRLSIRSDELYDLLPDGVSYEKRIPRKFMNLDKISALNLIKGFIWGDGRITDKANYNGKQYSADVTSKGLVDDLQELSFKIGWPSNVYQISKKRLATTPSTYNKENNRWSICRPVWRISWSSEKRGASGLGLTEIKREKVQEIDYDGFIYDVNVPNHKIAVRRDGRIMWSGNSMDSLRYAFNGISQTSIYRQVI